MRIGGETHADQCRKARPVALPRPCCGQPGMYHRYFTPESGTIGADRLQVADRLNWADAASTFQSGSSVYVAARSSGTLYRFTWDGTKAVAATAAAVSGPGIDGKDWRANTMWLR